MLSSLESLDVSDKKRSDPGDPLYRISSTEGARQLSEPRTPLIEADHPTNVFTVTKATRIRRRASSKREVRDNIRFRGSTAMFIRNVALVFNCKFTPRLALSV